jgi:hypothetical protein
MTPDVELRTTWQTRRHARWLSEGTLDDTHTAIE